MNKEHDRYYRMINGVQTVFDENSTVWSPIPVIVDSKNRLDELMQRINAIYSNNHDNSQAITREKSNKRTVAINKAVILAAALSTLGEIDNIESLKTFKTIGHSKLERLPEMEMVETTQALAKTAHDHKEALIPFGISEPQIIEMETSLDDFRHLIGEARIVRNSVYANIKEADMLFDEANNLLRTRFDKLIKLFELNQPKFFDLYKRARVIVN